MLIKVLSNFFLPIPLDGRKRRNRCVLGKKAFSKSAFLIFSLHNSSEDTFLLFSLYLLIISSSFHLLAVGLDVGIFGKNNARKSREDDPEIKV